jgi:hypothetical protein
MQTRVTRALWRLKGVAVWLVFESFKSLVLVSSFWDFLWRPAQLLYCKIRHIVTVTMKTIKESFKITSLSGFLWWLKTVTMRLVLESSKSLFLASSFFTFSDGQLSSYYKTRHKILSKEVTKSLLKKSKKAVTVTHMNG